MSSGPVCRCGRREAWRVAVRRGNFSAFSGYRFTPSRYSEVECVPELGGCGRFWRTAARYVDDLPDLPLRGRPPAS